MTCRRSRPSLPRRTSSSRRTPSLIAIAQLDDLVGEFTAVNLPGTDRERPNWRRKLRGTIADFASAVAVLTLPRFSGKYVKI